MRLLSFLAALLLSAVLLPAAGVTGKWSGTWDKDPDGNTGTTHFMVLKQTGSVVTGTAGPNEQAQFPFEKGKLDGAALTFDLVIPNGPTFKFAFTIDGDSAAGQCDFNGERLKLSVTRAK